jgi:tetratricopeptide (TPR) repeat protein
MNTRPRIRLWTIGLLLGIAAAVCIKLSVVRSNTAWERTLAQSNIPITERQVAEAAERSSEANSAPVTRVAPLDPKQPVRLALGLLGLVDDEQNRRLNDLVLADLNDAPDFELVERQSLEAALTELRLSWSGFVRAKDAVHAGKLLKADWFLFATPAKVKNNNSLVLRMVDARTGILRDADVVSRDIPLAQLAEKIAVFVRQSRQNALSGQHPVFLAIGTFEDASPNNRQAEFPAQLRGYLTAAYQGSKVTLLEREYVDALLREVHLDLEGLTENSAGNSSVPMQSAFWLASGVYDSVESNRLEIALTVQRIFGRNRNVTIDAKSGEDASLQIKQAIDGIIKQGEVVVPSRMSEIRTQMLRGREIQGGDAGGPFALIEIGNPWIYYDGTLSVGEIAHRKRNVEEAVRAFETVLLLDPTNRVAKIHLALSLRHPTIRRVDEARRYYREIIEYPIQDQWSDLAQKALIESFYDETGVHRIGDPVPETIAPVMARWFASAAGETSNSSARDFYLAQAKLAEGDSALTPEKRLFQSLASFEDFLHGKMTNRTEIIEMYEFVTSFNDRARAAQRLTELFPAMTNRFPDLKPYLLAEISRYQVDTNAPIIGEFHRELQRLKDNTEQVLLPQQFWPSLYVNCYWAFDHKLYDLVALIFESRRQVASKDPNIGYIFNSKEEDDIALAFAYRGMERWQQALDVFETFSNRPVHMFYRGPWGGGDNIVLTSKEAAFCAQKLGLARVRAKREFDLGASCLPPGISAFAVDDDHLWAGLNGQLLTMDFDLNTKKVVAVPEYRGTCLCSLCVSPSKVWAGTDGGGLIEFDKSSGHCRLLTTDDGLLMDRIASLNLAGDTLWIGYGERTYSFTGTGGNGDGGLGRLDLSTHQFTSFTQSLEDTVDGVFELANKPTRHAVIVMTHGTDNDIWFITQENGTRLRHYRAKEQIWEADRQACSSLALDANHLFVGQFGNYLGTEKSDALGVRILDLNTGKWRDTTADQNLTPDAVSALALDGDKLWVGGMGYLALLDFSEGKVQKFARVSGIPCQLRIGGGYVWALINGRLHRAPLASIQ